MRRTQASSRHGYFLCLLLIFAAALFLRAWRIAEVPDIVHIDEAGLGRNAWCLANYGIDRYFNELPTADERRWQGEGDLYWLEPDWRKCGSRHSSKTVPAGRADNPRDTPGFPLPGYCPR